MDTLAHLQHALGDKKTALATAEKAYQLSGEAPEYKLFLDQVRKELAE